MKRSWRNFTLAIKRLFDLAVSVSVLFLLAPLLGLIAFAIKLDDRGPILFVQNRVGKQRRMFRCYKLRTMVIGAETIGDGYTVTADDARITRLGKFLRQWTLDEIPQLVNVVKGDMSIVGPRPWVAEQAQLCSAAQQRRFAMRPGMAGWAWIHGRNQLPFDERIRLDLWYIDNWTLWLDFKILAIAFVHLFRRVGVFVPADMNKDLDIKIVNGNRTSNPTR